LQVMASMDHLIPGYVGCVPCFLRPARRRGRIFTSWLC